MEDQNTNAAFISALTTEHFVLQTAGAAMIAFLNNLVAGATATLAVTALFGRDRLAIALAAGIATAAVLMAFFISYQTKRFEGLQKMFEASRNEGLTDEH